MYDGDPGDENDASGADEGGQYHPEPPHSFSPGQPSQRPEPGDETYRSQADGTSAPPPARRPGHRPAELDDAARRGLTGDESFSPYAKGTDPHAIRLHEQIVKRLQDYARMLRWD